MELVCLSKYQSMIACSILTLFEENDLRASTKVAHSVTVVLGGVAGGVARGAKVGTRIMYIDAFSPMSLLLPLRNVLYI